MGNFQFGSSALLRNVSRGGGQVFERGKVLDLSGQHAQVGLPTNDALLEREVARATAVQSSLPRTRNNRARTHSHSEAFQKPKVNSFRIRNAHTPVAQILCINFFREFFNGH